MGREQDVQVNDAKVQGDERLKRMLRLSGPAAQGGVRSRGGRVLLKRNTQARAATAVSDKTEQRRSGSRLPGSILRPEARGGDSKEREREAIDHTGNKIDSVW